TEQGAGRWLWKGWHVKVVDGTGLSMPETPENQEAYPQHKGIPAGIGFPLLWLVGLFCPSVGTVLDAAMARYSGKGTGEVSLFRAIDDVLDAGDVLVGDRIYSTFWDVARLKARGGRGDAAARGAAEGVVPGPGARHGEPAGVVGEAATAL